MATLGYTDGSIELAQIVARATGKTEAPEVATERAASRLSQQAALDQLDAVRREVVAVLDAAREVLGRDPAAPSELEPDANLLDVAGFQRDVDTNGMRAVAATMFVMQDRIRLEASQCADALEVLGRELTTVAHPTLLTLSRRLEQFAVGMRPPERPTAHEDRP